MALSERQQRFCKEYVACWDEQEAARRAGYKERMLDYWGRRNLRDEAVQQEIKRLCAAAVCGFGGEVNGLADGEEILMFLTAVMRGVVRDGKNATDGSGGNLPKVSERTKAAELLGRNQHLFSEKGGRGDEQEFAVRILGAEELRE